MSVTLVILYIVWKLSPCSLSVYLDIHPGLECSSQRWAATNDTREGLKPTGHLLGCFVSAVWAWLIPLHVFLFQVSGISSRAGEGREKTNRRGKKASCGWILRNSVTLLHTLTCQADYGLAMVEVVCEGETLSTHWLCTYAQRCKETYSHHASAACCRLPCTEA